VKDQVVTLERVEAFTPRRSWTTDEAGGSSGLNKNHSVRYGQHPVCGHVMTNPFEDENASYFVLVNEEGQHSLWPQAIEVPAGWTTTFGAAGRQACLDRVETSWTDLRPASLVRAMGS